MALSRVTTWTSGQVLTASALNGEFDNILNNGASLVFPLTAAVNFSGQVLQNLAAGSVTSPGVYINSDSDTGLYSSAANTMDITTGGVRSASFASVTGATSYLAVSHAAVTVPHEVTLTAAGTASNINLRVAAKGTGYVILPAGSSTLPGAVIGTNNGSGLSQLAAGTLSLMASNKEVVRVSGFAAAGDYLDLRSSSLGNAVFFVAPAGDNTNIDLTVDTKGTGTLTLGSADTTSVTAATAFVPAAFGGANPPLASALFTANLCVAWANFTGSSGAIGAGHGISSITRHAAGEYTANLFTAMAATPYGVFGLAQSPAAAVSHLLRREGSAQTTSSCRFIGVSTTGTATEIAEACVFFMGKQ